MTEENTPPAFGSAAAPPEQHPPTIRDNLSVLTVRDRKTAQHQREQQVTAADQPKRSAIVSARKPQSGRSLEPDMTPEEHKRRGDAADAMFREFKRLIARALPSKP
jgi:hypothetical protein